MIRVPHPGSLPRREPLVHSPLARDKGEPCDAGALETMVQATLAGAVRRPA